jgi:hypothetical protein
MSVRVVVVLILGLAAACGAASTPRATVNPNTPATAARVDISPSTTAGAAAEGVLMFTGQGQLGGTTSTKYSLYVITSDGRTVRSATAGIQSAGWHLPRFSVAGHSVYFLDGDRDLKVLRSDGSVGTIGQLPGGSDDRVVFAVSPDEQQIAYSVLHYASGGKTTTSLRVGPLASLNVHEIFSGPPIEYPIGWSAGRLVIAVTPSASIQNPGYFNPYSASAYHVADANTADRIYSTSPTCDSPSALEGPVNALGTICQQNSGKNWIFLALGWNGSSRELFRMATDSGANQVPPAVLNPGGQSAAAGSAADHRINLLSGGVARPTAAIGTPAGWFDASHMLFMAGPCCQPLTSAAVLDVNSNTVTPVGAGMAGSADPYAPFFVPIPTSLN